MVLTVGLLALAAPGPCEARSASGSASALPAGARQWIAGSEYHASLGERGLQAPNRAHGLRTYFEASGIRLHERSGSQARELLRLSLRAAGRGARPARVEPGDVVERGARVEIRRPGLVEWYRNSPAGLEQGFTLECRPEGPGALVLELGVEGARASLHGDEVVLETRAGRSLSYAKLAALDARGRHVPARLGVPDAERIRLEIDDASAVYPLVIDPLLTAAVGFIDSDQDGSLLGFSVAGAGDVDGDGYDDVIVGAYLYDAGESNEGAAFVFLGGVDGVPDSDPGSAATRLESDQANAEFGISVAGAGDVDGDGYDDVIVGARSYDATEIDEGAAFVFRGGASGIPPGDPGTAAAVLESNQDFAAFGASVAGAGDVDGDGYDDVIVGAYLYESDALNEDSEGAAFVFLGGPSGVVDGNPGTAAATLESNQEFALLGLAVAGAGDVNGDTYDDVIVGAPFYDAGEDNEGAAFVFLGSASGVADGDPTTAAARLESDQQDADMGFSVAGAGDVNGDGYADVIVGADEYDAPEDSEGAAFVFLGSASGIADGDPASADARLESNQAGADFGISVAGAGDLDGDGYADVIVGAHLYSDAAAHDGAAFAFLGGPGGIADGDPGSAAMRVSSGAPGSELGRSVAGAGDTNGDGRAELIVGAPAYDGPNDPGQGAAFVYTLKPVPPVPALSSLARAVVACALVLLAARLLVPRTRLPL